MADKSIFYTSNSNTNIFPSNSRGSFVSHLDESEFGYLGLIDKQNVKIGLKEITFDNTYNTFRTKYGSPNMVIIQDNYGKKIVPNFDTVHSGPESPEIDINQAGITMYCPIKDLLIPSERRKHSVVLQM